MVIHCCTHLFRNGNFARGLRDLLDLKALLGDFRDQDPNFTSALAKRATMLGVERPCALAFHFMQRYLAPDDSHTVPLVLTRALPSAPTLRMLDALFRMASLPAIERSDARARRVALWLLERYPPHVLRKTIVPKLERAGIYTLRPRH
jgi:hypothetical protein